MDLKEEDGEVAVAQIEWQLDIMFFDSGFYTCS